MRFVLACAVLGAALGCPRPGFAAEQKIALVIGNSAYPTSRLRNPVNDAKAMADKLKALGFDVILKTDASQREMTRSFSQFGQKLTLGSVGLFYYAGHGMQVQGKNFLIPVDAEIENEASVRTEAVDVDQLLHQLGPARLSMVILDACRNNPFERRFRGASGGLAQIDAPTGTLLAYATAPGKVASDGTGSNGLYTEALLKALNMPGLKVEDIFKQVRINVVKASEGTQTPWESSSLTGEFYFTPDNKPALADEKLKQTEKERADLAKELDESRKQRDKDAALVKAEMEKLRAELRQIRAEAAKPTAPAVVAAVTTSPTTKPAPGSTPEKPVQVAIATPPPRPVSLPAPPASIPIASPIPPATAPAPPPQQVAIAAPPPSRPAISPAPADEWKDGIALLEKFSGQLTYSKAMAILLGIKSDEELEVLVKYDAFMRRVPWQSVIALGVNANGYVTWSNRWSERKLTYAIETAMANCNKNDAESACRLVMVNGEFQKKEFIEVAKRLGKNTPDAARIGLIQGTAGFLARQ